MTGGEIPPCLHVSSMLFAAATSSSSAASNMNSNVAGWEEDNSFAYTPTVYTLRSRNTLNAPISVL